MVEEVADGEEVQLFECRYLRLHEAEMLGERVSRQHAGIILIFGVMHTLHACKLTSFQYDIGVYRLNSN